MKNIELTLEDLLEIPGSEVFNSESLDRISAVSADSRKVPQGSLFIAIKGERFDGHDFIDDAVKNGASAIMISRNKKDLLKKLNLPVLLVDDTVKGLGSLASVWRKKLETKVFALTGSAGKTTTKEMLATVLSEKYKINKTSGNNNNHIGVPFTLLDTNNSHEILIAELGTNHFGEIRYTAEIARPDYALITNIGHSHLEFLKDLKGVMKEKGILFDVTASNSGVIFVNADDAYIRKYAQNYQRKVTYGFKGNHDVSGEILNYNETGNAEVEITHRDKKFRVRLPSPGEQAANNFLAVCAAAFRLGLKSDEIKNGISKFSNVSKRLNVKKKRGFVLIDDSYNANPDSMKYSISLLTKFPEKKKIIILGDMFELGDDAEELHRKLARHIIKSKIDEVYLIGRLMEFVYEELKKEPIKSRHFIDRETLKKFLEEEKFSNSVILVKGSRGMKMEEFVETLEVHR